MPYRATLPVRSKRGAVHESGSGCEEALPDKRSRTSPSKPANDVEALKAENHDHTSMPLFRRRNFNQLRGLRTNPSKIQTGLHFERRCMTAIRH
jgi:hypothetical protein